MIPLLRRIFSIQYRNTKFQSNNGTFHRDYSCSVKTLSSSSDFEDKNIDDIIFDKDLIENLKLREYNTDVKKLRDTWTEIKGKPSEQREKLKTAFFQEILKLPNKTHLASRQCGNSPKVLRTYGCPLKIENPKELHEICSPLDLLRKDNLGDLASPRSYIFKGFLAELEQALIQFTMNFLKNENFEFISVSDLIYAPIIENCGFPVHTKRTMVYQIETNEGEEPFYLSGTAEIGISGYLSNRILPKRELPLKLACLSRCFRAEISKLEEEHGIYRVHNFGKIEMFGVTTKDQSETQHAYFCELQERIFKELGLHYRVLEMSPNELGLPAFRKFDIEAWMPGRKAFGEISSCSNCTDYQASRLNIRYIKNDESTIDPNSTKEENKETLEFAHTINGTACAIPRMIIAIIESCQDENGYIHLPESLKRFMRTEWRPINSIPKKERPKKPIFLKSGSAQDNIIKHYDSWRISSSAE